MQYSGPNRGSPNAKSGGSKRFKKCMNLVVKDCGMPSVIILDYIYKNMSIIKKIGLYILVTKVCEEDLDKRMVQKLGSKGIHRFPALINDNGKACLGVTKIKNYLSKEISKMQRGSVLGRVGPMGNSFSMEPELDSLFRHEMTLEAAERDRKESSDDQTMGGNSGDEFNHKMREFMFNRKDKNKTVDQMDEDEFDRRTPAYRQSGRPNVVMLDPEEENIAPTRIGERFNQTGAFMEGNNANRGNANATRKGQESTWDDLMYSKYTADIE